MLNHDRLFKELLTKFFVEFVELFLPQVAPYFDGSSLDFLDKELFSADKAAQSSEAELVVKAKFKGRHSFFLIHTEIQARSEPELGERLFDYYILLRQKYRLPIYPIVIFSFDYPLTTQPTVYEERFPDLAVLRYQYRVIQLNQLDWRLYTSSNNPVAAAFMSKMPIAQGDRPAVKLNCLTMLAGLKLISEEAQIISGFIDTYLKLNQEETRQYELALQTLSPQRREEVMEIVTSWMEDGIKKGRIQGLAEGQAKGRAEGRQQEAYSIALRLLNRRFGPVDDSVENALSSLPIERLEDLTENILEFGALGDLHVWLKKISEA